MAAVARGDLRPGHVAGGRPHDHHDARREVIGTGPAVGMWRPVATRLVRHGGWPPSFPPRKRRSARG